MQREKLQIPCLPEFSWSVSHSHKNGLNGPVFCWAISCLPVLSTQMMELISSGGVLVSKTHAPVKAEVGNFYKNNF